MVGELRRAMERACRVAKNATPEMREQILKDVQARDQDSGEIMEMCMNHPDETLEALRLTDAQF